MDDTNERRQCVVLAAIPENHFLDGIHHGGSITLLTRVVARILRFIGGTESITGNRLSVAEMHAARLVIIGRIQQVYYWDEIQNLRKKKPIAAKSPLRFMDPFLDGEGVLRLTGREEKAYLSYEEHPIILPERHPFTKLLLHQIHIDNFHVGTQA